MHGLWFYNELYDEMLHSHKSLPQQIGFQVVWQKVQKISVQFLFRRMFACSVKHCCIRPIKTSSYSFKEPFIPACKEFHQLV